MSSSSTIFGGYISRVLASFSSVDCFISNRKFDGVRWRVNCYELDLASAQSTTVLKIYLSSTPHPSWVWPHPGRSRRVGHHSNVRFCSTAKKLQPNQIAEFKCWRRDSLLNESVTGNSLELNQNATIVDKPAWCRNTPSQLELVACKSDSCSSILTELCGYRPLGIKLSHTLKVSTSGTKPDIAVVPNPTWASRVGPRPTTPTPPRAGGGLPQCCGITYLIRTVHAIQCWWCNFSKLKAHLSFDCRTLYHFGDFNGRLRCFWSTRTTDCGFSNSC